MSEPLALPSSEALIRALALPPSTTAKIEQIEDAAVIRITLPAESVTLVLPYEWFVDWHHAGRVETAVRLFRAALSEQHLSAPFPPSL